MNTHCRRLKNVNRTGTEMLRYTSGIAGRGLGSSPVLYWHQVFLGTKPLRITTTNTARLGLSWGYLEAEGRSRQSASQAS